MYKFKIDEYDSATMEPLETVLNNLSEQRWLLHTLIRIDDRYMTIISRQMLSKEKFYGDSDV